MSILLLLLGTVLLGCTPQIIIGRPPSADEARWQQEITTRVGEHDVQIKELQNVGTSSTP